jgi:hypothetical protein
MKKAVKFLYTIFFLLIFYDCSSGLINEETTNPKQYILTIKASEGGTISPDANGIYNEGATLTLTASPDKGYRFNRWEGTDNDSRPNGCGAPHTGNCRAAITMDSDKDIQAFFEKIK